MIDMVCWKLGLPSKHGEIYKLSQLFMIWRDKDAYLQTNNIKYLDISLVSGMFVFKREQAHSQCAVETEGQPWVFALFSLHTHKRYRMNEYQANDPSPSNNHFLEYNFTIVKVD